MSSQASLGDNDDNCRYFSPEWRAIVAFLLILLNQKPINNIDYMTCKTWAILSTCKNCGSPAFLGQEGHHDSNSLDTGHFGPGDNRALCHCCTRFNSPARHPKNIPKLRAGRAGK